MNHRIVGFDFGLKRIGVATGNEVTGTAQSLESIPAKNGAPQWHLVDKVIAQWNPTLLIVGLPLKMDGSEGDMTELARRFAAQLRSRYSRYVSLVDERLSSSEADHLLTKSAQPGKSRARKRAQNRDSLAAELIIKTYLNDNRHPQ